jgi:catechol 2,3-dioxygenase-like lactoylglutathione lyase family enzyme
MALSFAMTTIVVDDYDRAIKHYIGDLGFTLLEDTALTPEKRWVVVAPGSHGGKILLAKAQGDSQVAAIGNSTGGRVAFFLHTDNFDQTYEKYRANDVEFTESPRHESFGKVVVFKDIYGNKWDLIESQIG